MSKVELRDAQLLMKTILRDVDKLCRENNIEYWVESGTLLGAVRHKGFIPWDDDIDIGMERSSYEKFLAIANKYLPEDLFLQNAQLDSGVEYSWTKVKHKNSKLVENGNNKCHEGIFIDIFPYDYYECNFKDKSYMSRKYFEYKYKLIFDSKLPYEQFNSKTLSQNIKRFIFKSYNKIIIRKSLNEVILERQKKAAKNSSRKNRTFLGYGSEVAEFGVLVNSSTIFPLKEIKFENIKVKCPNNNKKYLETLYGKTFMQLPNEANRCWHNKGIYIYEPRK